MSNRMTLWSMYSQHPEGLALELEQLFQPHKDPVDAVLHNKVVDLITTLTSKRSQSRDPATDLMTDGDIAVDCVPALAKSLAQAILHHATPEVG